ncbi:MAG: hypothetical protein ACTS8Z_06480, partial [Candidatus Limnocylindrales bacterium]
PLLVGRRVIDDSHGRPIEATESRYPGDRYALDVRFDGEGPDVSQVADTQADDPLPGEVP